MKNYNKKSFYAPAITYLIHIQQNQVSKYFIIEREEDSDNPNESKYINLPTDSKYKNNI